MVVDPNRLRDLELSLDANQTIGDYWILAVLASLGVFLNLLLQDVKDLAGEEIFLLTHQVLNEPMLVFVARLNSGRFESYQQDQGYRVHTKR
jgi:hypothetical protein